MTEINLGLVEKLPVGGSVTGESGAFRIVVFRTANGDLYALEDRCSHADVRLSGGMVEGCEIECPAHGARFDLKTGNNLCMPAVVPVRSFPVQVRNGEIFVTV